MQAGYALTARAFLPCFAEVRLAGRNFTGGEKYQLSIDGNRHFTQCFIFHVVGIDYFCTLKKTD